MPDTFGYLVKLAGSIGVLVIVFAIVYVVHTRLLALYKDKPQAQYRRQMLMLGVVLVAILVSLVLMPIGDTMRGQLLSLLGILLSASIALSATTMVGNAIAGLQIRALRKLKVGSYVSVGEYFGRVSEMELFHVEIQTEDRNLTSLPNIYVVTNPITVMHSSGTILSVDLSLGYDVDRKLVEKVLLKAAEDVGLETPFVQIRELGDFSISYQVSGVLCELKSLIATRRQLRGRVIDALHAAGIEIVSPNFVNQRVFDTDARFMSDVRRHQADEDDDSPDQVVFAKAEQAESVANLKEQLDTIQTEITELEVELKTMEEGPERSKILIKKKKLEAKLVRTERRAEAKESDLHD